MADDKLDPRECLYGYRFEKQGHVVIYYRDGSKIIRDVNDGLRYDLAVIDLSLPGLDGVEVIRRLKLKYPRVPVISASGYVVLNSDADDKVVKPFRYNELMRVVNKFLPGTLEQELF